LNITDARDVSFLEGLDVDGREVTGIEVYKQEIWHRLNSRRGTLEGSPGDGIDLLDFQHLEIDDRAIAEIEATVRNECLKDERTTGCKCTATYSEPRTITIRIWLQTNDGDLVLVAAISGNTTELLRS
jgi:hypothetical protein